MDQLRSIFIATVVAAFIASAVAYATRLKTQDLNDTRYGNQAGAVLAAARGFASSNRTNVIEAVNAAGGGAAVYHVSDMIGAGVLDPSINGSTPTGGTWCLEFRTYNAGANLQGVLTVVGETAPLGAIDAAVVAQAAGSAFTGVVDATGTVAYPGGGQALSAFTGASACHPAVNAFAALITDNDSIGTTNWLARVQIPGNPSANRMTVDLDMGGNTINSINNATATGTIQAAELVATTSVTAPVVYHSSDRGLKEAIRPITNPWPLLAPIVGSRWTMAATGQSDAGVIAQDVEKSMPELVSLDTRGQRAVNYDGLFAPTIAALKDLHRQVAADHREISCLRAALAKVRRAATAARAARQCALVAVR
jgi:hypothetical protein